MKSSKTTNLGASSLFGHRAIGAVVLTACLALALALVAVPSRAAVTVDAVSTGAANNLRTGVGYATSITVSHTVSGTFRLLIVSVSMNINNNGAASVTDFPTYGGTNMAFVGQALNANDNRVRIYSLVAPATGTANVVVNFSGLNTNAVGAVVGVISFVGVNQTAPLGTFAGAQGNATPATVNVTTVAGDLVIDTMSGNGNRTATVGAGQTERWNRTSGGNDANLDSRAAGSTELATGTATTMSYTLSGDAQWAIGAVPIKPATTSDISVSKTGPYTAPPSTSQGATYTITVTNIGPSTSTDTRVADTLPSGFSCYSVSCPSGTCGCTSGPGGLPGCTGISLTSGSSATVTIVANTGSTLGSLTDTATVSTTNYDPTPGNDTANWDTVVQNTSCGTPGKDGTGGTLGGIVNTYYPGTASAIAGATSVTLGASRGATTTIAPGDLVLLVQMQDAEVNATDDANYGSNAGTGSGWSYLNNAGRYEYVRATNSVGSSGGTLNLVGAGSGGGLLFAYTNADYGTQGQRRFQAVRVPQYATATTSATLTASSWNGRTGGILAFDVEGALTLSGTVSVNALGFRGGGGQGFQPGAAGSNTAYRTAMTLARNGNKGEGIAGTPRYMYNGTTTLDDNTVEGYPNGSRARGAPGTAGGGGTDGDASANDENSGGGGGANGGAGGRGGYSWNTEYDVGGRGGTAFLASPIRLTLGGGGGAGNRNNSSGVMSSGGIGGGAVLVRAGSVGGTGTITANGGMGVACLEDGGGGGGAGGTVLVFAQSGGLTGLTAQANGAAGTTAWATEGPGTGCGTAPHGACNYHGPGGGGGGGVVILTSAPTTAPTVTGGVNGTTCTDANAYGATSGAAGKVINTAPVGSIPGATFGTSCPTNLAIMKTDAPDPINQGQTLTYTITVTNNGLAGATDVILTDPLPAGTTCTGVTPSQGTCTGGCNGGNLNCNLGYLALGASATITVTATVNTPSIITNTATTNCHQNLTNVQGSATTTVRYPTFVDAVIVQAEREGGRVILSWRTGYEVSNLGFQVYRDIRGVRTLITPAPIAGSALLFGQSTRLQGGFSYAWVDDSPDAADPGVSYWLEDLDVNGAHTVRGPFAVASSTTSRPGTGSSPLLTEVARTVPPSSREVFEPVEETAENDKGGDPLRKQWELAGKLAVKIKIRQAGWYQVTQPELLSAGLPADANPSNLQLWVDGVERAIVVNSQDPSLLGPQDSIEFWAEGLDTRYTDTRVAWLVAGDQPGKRVPNTPATQPPAATANSYQAIVERRDKTVYASAIHNGEEDNFFGALISTQPLDQTITMTGLSSDRRALASLEVSLQGANETPGLSPDHQVAVMFNGHSLDGISFQGLASASRVYSVPQTWLAEGTNTVHLTATAGARDYSFVKRIRITYTRTFTASQDALRFNLEGLTSATVKGFTTKKIRLLDITDPSDVQEFTIDATEGASGYEFTFLAPVPGKRVFYAFSMALVSHPAEVVADQPSSWNIPQNTSDHVIIAHPSFVPAMAGLQALRTSQGLASTVIDVTDLYDEFSYGAKSPQAIRDFLALARSSWKLPPRYVLLAGDATIDPRNYLRTNATDFVDTKLIETTLFETGSDDWFADFGGTGIPTMAIGRLPVSTPEGAAAVVSKIVSCETDPPGAAWQREVMLVADQNRGFDFEAETAELAGLIPSSYTVSRILRGQIGPAAARTQILSGFSSGKVLVEWAGHGSVEVWGSENLLRSGDAPAMSNKPRLPFVLGMTCLNGYFVTPYQISLGEALMNSAGGGALAVWGSSGLADPAPQVLMEQALVRWLFGGAAPTIGEAVAAAKTATGDMDVRRTWILLGDPATKLH